MPDSGSNGYLHINPDGTVVVPNNLTPEGVIIAGDLVDHDELQAVADDAAEATANVQANVDALDADTVKGGGLRVSNEYSVEINVAGGADTFFTRTVDDVLELSAWDSWTVLGQFIGTSGALAFNGPDNLGGNTLQLSFTSQAQDPPQLIEGTFYFRLIGTPT